MKKIKLAIILSVLFCSQVNADFVCMPAPPCSSGVSMTSLSSASEGHSVDRPTGQPTGEGKYPQFYVQAPPPIPMNNYYGLSVPYFHANFQHQLDTAGFFLYTNVTNKHNVNKNDHFNQNHNLPDCHVLLCSTEQKVPVCPSVPAPSALLLGLIAVPFIRRFIC